MFQAIPCQTWAQTWAQNVGAVMAKQINSLKSSQLLKAKPGKLNNGGGLYLITKLNKTVLLSEFLTFTSQ